MIRYAARLLSTTLLFSLLAGRALAADLELRYAALERLIAEQMFSQDGRRYVRGTPSAHCQYAYLEAPHVAAAGAEANANGRLKVTAKFSGRSAVDIFGRCMGMGDSFDLTIVASPVARKGVIAMDDVSVATLKDSYYIRRVRSAMTDSFSKNFKIDIRDQARKLLTQPAGTSAYQQELSDFDVSSVRVTPEALVLTVNFKLVVK